MTCIAQAIEWATSHPGNTPSNTRELRSVFCCDLRHTMNSNDWLIDYQTHKLPAATNRSVCKHEQLGLRWILQVLVEYAEIPE